MTEPLRVALLIESSRGYGRHLLAGVGAYARIFGPWTFFHEERSLGDPLPSSLKRWRPQGILARMESPSLTQQIRRLGLPTVGVPHRASQISVPQVIANQDAIVCLAVEHLRERRLEHFAYCGYPNIEFSDDRCRRFVRDVNAMKYPVEVFSPRTVARSQRLAVVEKNARLQADVLATWLLALPKPIGLMACNDMRAFQVLSVCREAGILVPDEVAVIGVDNDAVQCELCDPPLSSIDNNARQVGYRAAALLHQMIQHRSSVPRWTFIKPAGVFTRRSTDVLAVADRETIEIVRYVRDHACEELTPTVLARRMAMSRSTLERRFSQNLGHSVSQEIHRVRLNRIKELLVTSDLSLSEIARLTGFEYVETMQRTFKNSIGQTPGQYRHERRGSDTAIISATC